MDYVEPEFFKAQSIVVRCPVCKSAFSTERFGVKQILFCWKCKKRYSLFIKDFDLEKLQKEQQEFVQANSIIEEQVM